MTKRGQGRAIGSVCIADCMSKLGFVGLVLASTASMAYAERAGHSVVSPTADVVKASSKKDARTGANNDVRGDVHEYRGKVQRISPDSIAIETQGEVLELKRDQSQSSIEKEVAVGDLVEGQYTVEGRMLELRKVRDVKGKRQRAGEKGDDRKLDDSAHYFTKNEPDSKQRQSG